MLALAALAYVGVRYAGSPRGRYVLATLLPGGGAERVKPVIEGALARAAEELDLPTPYPRLNCVSDTTGGHLCSTVVGLTPGVSPMQGNAKITSVLLDLGVKLESGTEAADGTVNLRFRAGSDVLVAIDLVPAAGTGLDTVVTPAPGLSQVQVRARLALIINDYGENGAMSRRFERLPGTFTAAVRSNLDNAQGWAKEARQGGMEVILNLPLEPKNYPTRNPGDNAILVDHSGREIRKRVKKAIDSVAPATGVKTYMGSLAVEDRDVMRPLLEELKKRNLFLVESTRSQYSTVPDLSREIGVPIYEVTSISEVDSGRRGSGTIGIRFDDLIRRCRAKGYAVGIIHAKGPTLEVLEDRLPALAREGIVVMGLSEVMKAHALE